MSSKHHKTIAYCILDLLKQKTSINLEDIKQAYIVKTRKTPSRQAYYYAIKGLEQKGKIKTNRYGKKRLTISSIVSSSTPKTSMVSLNLSSKLKRPMHSAHHIKFTIKYEGTQPKDGILKPWGRYKTSSQTIYKNHPTLGKKITLQVFKHSIRVSTFKPDGITTQEQLINAKAQTYKRILKWAKQRNLKLQEFGQIFHSEHVVELKAINELMRPVLTGPYAEAIEQRTGTHICPSSHKGKIEHTGRNPEDHPNNLQIKAKDVAIGFEYVFVEMKHEMQKLKEEQKVSNYERKEFDKQLSLYAENIKLHLRVLSKMEKTLDKMRRKL